MMKISYVVCKEFDFIQEQVEKQAKKYGFDLSKDDDVNRLNLITDGERIVHKRSPNKEIPHAWRSASFAERTIGTAYDFLHQLDVTIESAPEDTNDCECCNPEARAIQHLTTLNFIVGFLSGNGIHEFTEDQQSTFFSKLGRGGAQKRHAPMAELREWAVKKYRAQTWNSANEAAHALAVEVVAYGRTIGAELKPSNAQRTIYDWFLKSA